MTQEAFERHSIAGPQGELAVYRGGEHAQGVPLLLVHADAGRASQWFEVMQLLADRHPVTAFDLRGHGASAPAANGDLSYEGRAADLAAVADASGYDAFVLVAHSGGAAVALQYALAHTDRVRGLFLLDPAGDPRAIPQEMVQHYLREIRGPNSLATLQGYYTSIAGNDAAARERVLRDAATAHESVRAPLMEALVAWDPRAALSAWHGPITIVAADSSVSPAALHVIRGDIPHEVIASSGHWIQLEHPRRVAELIEAFAGGR